MNTTITPASHVDGSAASAPIPGIGGRVTMARVVVSEWLKLRSLRSTWLTFGATLLTLVGLGLLICGLTAAHWADMPPASRAHFDPVEASFGGVFFAQLALGVLGVLVVTGEYSTGTIRASLTAVPRRLPVLWAKAGVFAVVTFGLTGAGAFAAFLGGQALLGAHGTTVGPPQVLRVFGVALYLTVVGLLGIGLGALLRSTAGGIAVLFGVLLVVPISAGFLPSDWQRTLAPYLPSNAGAALYKLHAHPGMLAPWTGFALFAGYALAVIALAAVLLRRRDT